MFTSLQSTLHSKSVTLCPYRVIKTLFTCTLTGQAWLWSYQQLPSSSVTTQCHESRLGTHGCSWATRIRSFLERMGRGKGKLETAEKDSMGHICPQGNGQISSRMQWERWQPLLPPAHTWPVVLLLPCISECQPHEISSCSSLAQGHWSDIWSSLGKCPVSNICQT